MDFHKSLHLKVLMKFVKASHTGVKYDNKYWHFTWVHIHT